MDCVICTDSLESGTVRYLPCKHAFHVTCIDKWCKTSLQLADGDFRDEQNTCPTCRAVIDPRKRPKKRKAVDIPEEVTALQMELYMEELTDFIYDLLEASVSS